MLLGAAKMALQDAIEKKPGHFYSELIAMTMASLAIEAIANAVGIVVIKEWKDFESLNPNSKLRLICENIGIEYNSKKEPWSTAKWLYGFRNDVAHAKPELVNETYVWHREEFEKRKLENPKSKVESEISLGHARRAVERVTEIKDILCAKIEPDKVLGLWCDSWQGTTKLVE